MTPLKVCVVALAFFAEIIFFLFSKRWSKKTVGQLLVLDCFVSIFYFSAFVSPAPITTSQFWMLSEAILLFPALLGLLILYLLKMRKQHQCVPYSSVADWLASHVWEFALVTITLLSRFWMLDTIQKWDSSEYYYGLMQACQKFTFSLHDFYSAFKLANHPTHGFAFWAAIGEFLAPQNVAGVLAVSLCLTCAASVSIFHLLCRHFSKMKKWQAALGTVMCLFIPLYWAGFSCTMPDYFMTLFLIFMLSADLHENHLLLFFWGGMAAFCKEIGMVIVFSYFFVKVICLFFENKATFGQRIKNILSAPSVWAGVMIGIVLVAYMLVGRGVSSWSHSVYYSTPMTWSGSGDLLYNTFGIQADNIVTRLKEYFIVNFAWIFSALLLLAAAAWLITKHWKRTKVYVRQLMELVSILLSYGLFMCLYITAGSIRYNVVFSLFFALLVYVFLVDLIPGKLLGIGTVCVTILMLVQSFYSIDFVTNQLFRTVDVGNTKLLCISQETHQNPGGDYYITNLQYRSINMNFEKMFQQIHLQPEDTILITGQDYVECLKVSTLSELNGRHQDVKWNCSTQQYLNAIDTSLSPIRALNTNTLWSLREFPSSDAADREAVIEQNLASMPGRIFVYFSPFFQSGDRSLLVDQLEQVFELGEMHSVETYGNVLEFCELYVKDQENWNFIAESCQEEGTLDEITMRHFYNNLQLVAQKFEDTRTIVREGDTVALTIACYEDGAFLNMGTSPKGTILRTNVVGAGFALPGFDEAIIGREVGETVVVVCNVPDNYYNNPSIAGKTITMEITINSITKELPEITDEIIAETFGFENADAYIEFIRNSCIQNMSFSQLDHA